ncbi:MAG: U32 family peptidase [Bryobacterales bacterium]|nr:U32 family peptidase [Bryobacterales bacterium]
MSPSFSRRKSEIMSPAGYWPQAYAAIEAGADSVYFGLSHFSARAKVGFTLPEVPELMRELHRRGVRGYVAFNTLVFEHELGAAANAIESMAKAGVDALILQDSAAVRLARRIAPGLELHASTQMSITGVEGVRLAQCQGMSRVTLARELSLGEIRSIRQETDCDLEVFVHGALCVAYSGQCFSSEAWGGRSANRGQCAQACRLPYELIVDGDLEPLGDARYLLSPGDLFALRQVPELMDAGVAALKIEGRYKDADYVAATTAAYRKAVDEAWAETASTLTESEVQDLEQVYSRGMGPYFLTGTNHQQVVRGQAPRHRGVLCGRVEKIAGEAVWITPGNGHRVSPLKPGDGIVFDASAWRSPAEPEEGGRIYEVSRQSPESITLRFANRAIDFTRIRVGDRVWRTSDPDLSRRLKRFTEAAGPVARQPVDVHISAREGESLVLTWRLPGTKRAPVTVSSRVPLARAAQQPLSAETAREQLERLGGSAYRLNRLELEVSGSPFVPVSLLNALRREAVEALRARQDEWEQPIAEPAPAAVAAIRSAAHASGPSAQASLSTGRDSLPPQLHLLVRTPAQLDAALAFKPASITLDYLDLYGLKPSVDRVKESGIPARVAGPRVLKPGEDRILDFLDRLDCDLLVRSAGMLELLRKRGRAGLHGDFSLNVANSIAAGVYLEMALERISPTHDLNAAQILQLALDAGPERMEVVAYHHLPVFHTEHCVFCRFLSTGTSYKDCGRPCETHVVALRDERGRAHPLVADVGCRNTVFGAEAQTAAAHLEAWRSVGLRHFRLEFVHESAEQARRVSEAFRDALSGAMPFRELADALRALAPEGVTEGSLFVPSNYLQLPILQ